MKKLPLLLLPLLTGAFVLQGADWVFEIPEDEIPYFVGAKIVGGEQVYDYGESDVRLADQFSAAGMAEAIANNINARYLDKLVATSIGSKVYVDRKDKTATGEGSIVDILLEQWDDNGSPANYEDDGYLPLELLPESTYQGEGEGVGAVAQVDTITGIAGAPGDNDIFIVTLDGASGGAVRMGVDAAATATAIADRINVDFAGNHSLSGRVTATAVGVDVIVTANTPGTAFTLSIAAKDGPFGTITTAAATSSTTTANVVAVATEGEGEGEEEGEEDGNRTPVVKNVTAAQVEGTKLLRVNYDLEVSDDRPCTVTIRWSTNNGETFDTTAAAITGAVGPGVKPGEKLEAIWDMGEDWNNKYTEEGRVEVIANRIAPPEGLAQIEHPTGKWFVEDNEDFLNEKPPTEWRFGVFADSPGAESTMPAEDRKALEAAIETGSIRFVDVFYKDAEGREHAFFFDVQHPSVALRWLGVFADKFEVSVAHGSPIGPSTNLLTLDAIDYLGEGVPPKVLLGDLPTSSSLRLEIYIASGEHEEHEE